MIATESTGKPIVCVVDDEKAVRTSLSALLRSIGFEVHTFDGAPEFLLSGMAARCDALVADIHLKGMSGFDLQRTLLKAANTPPVVFISGHADEAAHREASDIGAVALLSKPFSEATLMASLREALGRERRGTGADAVQA